MVICGQQTAETLAVGGLKPPYPPDCAFVIGDRSSRTCRRLWQRIPASYRYCHSYSDFWHAYEQLLRTGKHHIVGKDSGQTAHLERWNCTLLTLTTSEPAETGLVILVAIGSKMNSRHYAICKPQENRIVAYH